MHQDIEITQKFRLVETICSGRLRASPHPVDSLFFPSAQKKTSERCNAPTSSVTRQHVASGVITKHIGLSWSPCVKCNRISRFVLANRTRTMSNRTYPSYWMYKDVRGEWRWTYEAVNGLTIAVSSEGYKHRADCERSIEIMKASTHSQTWLPSELVNAA